MSPWVTHAGDGAGRWVTLVTRLPAPAIGEAQGDHDGTQAPWLGEAPPRTPGHPLGKAVHSRGLKPFRAQSRRESFPRNKDFSLHLSYANVSPKTNKSKAENWGKFVTSEVRRCREIAK